MRGPEVAEIRNPTRRVLNAGNFLLPEAMPPRQRCEPLLGLEQTRVNAYPPLWGRGLVGQAPYAALQAVG